MPKNDSTQVHMRTERNIPLCRCSGPLRAYSLADEWSEVTCRACRGAVPHPGKGKVLRRIRCEDLEQFLSNLKETE